ncbi:nucleotide sugar dehydrogenase [Sphingosinicella humi]|uniref:UDP-N-acetyl-D-glucosamine dehydrogenase n=1 Tax=Allosphingosinicella humi TaxID=2068657 RepID=A0A2U2J186_9SPHN|nr:nucleotide sugar dehydrogenase [Sphingosinicella humi]PWG02092.1 UDP-N-acetyl-D-glucosamine dehydrogenase [Sphingosinicella humi]
MGIQNSQHQSAVERYRSRQATIGIVGLGYVGQPLAFCFVEGGQKVLGFDVNRRVVDLLNSGQSTIEHIGADRVASALSSGFEATTDYARVAEADCLIICVPTPLNRNREPDMSYIRATMASIEPHLREGQFIALESTTFPGTIDDEVLPVVHRRGLVPGETIFVAYSPEREDPGRKDYSTRTIPKLLGGVTPVCTEVGVACYEAAINTIVPVSSTKVAELAKLLENIQRAVNIGLVNEMKIVADRMGIDIHDVIDAAATKPFGFVPYYPGPGLGGHCIPIDPFYLTWKAREYGINTRFIELAGEVNGAMPDFVVHKIAMALNDRFKCIKGARVLVLGIAYKPDVDDMRESPSVIIMEKLRDLGAELSYSDPHIPVFPETREHHFTMTSVSLDPETLKSYDCVLLATHHAAFDYDMLLEHAPLIVDTRGRYRGDNLNVVCA